MDYILDLFGDQKVRDSERSEASVDKASAGSEVEMYSDSETDSEASFKSMSPNTPVKKQLPRYIKPKVDDFVNHTKDVMILRPSEFAGKRGVITEFFPSMYLVDYTRTVVKLAGEYSGKKVGDTVPVSSVESGVISRFIEPQYIVGCRTEESQTVVSEWIEDGDFKYEDESVDKFYKYMGQWIHVGDTLGVVKGVPVDDTDALLQAIESGLEYSEEMENLITRFEKSPKQNPDLIYVKGQFGKVTSMDGDEIEYKDYIKLEYQKESVSQHTKNMEDIFLFGITSSGSVVYNSMVVKGVNRENHLTEIPRMVKDGSMRFSGKAKERGNLLYAFINKGDSEGSYCPVVTVTQPLVEILVHGVSQFSKKQIEWESEHNLKGVVRDATIKTNKILSKVHKHANIEIDGRVYIKHSVDGKKVNFERVHYVHNDALYTDPQGAKKNVEIIGKKDTEWLIRVGNENAKVRVGSPNLLIYSDFKQLNPHLFSIYVDIPRLDSPEPYRPESPTYQPPSPSRSVSPGSERSFDEGAGDSESETESVGYNDAGPQFTTSFQDVGRLTFNPETLTDKEKPIFNRILKVLRMVAIDPSNVDIKPVIDAYLPMEDELYEVLLDMDLEENFTLEERAFLLLPLVYNALVEVLDFDYPEFVFKVLGFQFKKTSSKKLKLYKYKNSDLEDSLWLKSTWYTFSGCQEPRFNTGNESLDKIFERVFCYLGKYGVSLLSSSFDESMLIPLGKRKILAEDVPIEETQLYKAGFKKQRITDSEIRRLEKEQKELGAGVFPDSTISSDPLNVDFIDPQELKAAWQDYWEWQEQESEDLFSVQEEKEDASKRGKLSVLSREREPKRERKTVVSQKRKTRLERLNPHTDFSLKKQIITTKKSLTKNTSATEKARLLSKLESLEAKKVKEDTDKLASKFKSLSVKDRKAQVVKEFFSKVKNTETPTVQQIIKANWKDKAFVNATHSVPEKIQAKKLIRILYLQLRQVV